MAARLGFVWEKKGGLCFEQDMWGDSLGSVVSQVKRGHTGIGETEDERGSKDKRLSPSLAAGHSKEVD